MNEEIKKLHITVNKIIFQILNYIKKQIINITNSQLKQ